MEDQFEAMRQEWEAMRARIKALEAELVSRDTAQFGAVQADVRASVRADKLNWEQAAYKGRNGSHWQARAEHAEAEVVRWQEALSRLAFKYQALENRILEQAQSWVAELTSPPIVDAADDDDDDAPYIPVQPRSTETRPARIVEVRKHVPQVWIDDEEDA